MKFRSLTEAIDTETPTGRAMWQMIGVLAEPERKPELSGQQIAHTLKLIDGGERREDVAALLNVTAPLFIEVGARKGNGLEVDASICVLGSGFTYASERLFARLSSLLQSASA